MNPRWDWTRSRSWKSGPFIQSLGKDHTVILSSHILSEVQAVCQTILILSKGRLVACDTPENLEKRFAGTTTVELTAEATAEEVRAILAPLDHILEVTTREEPRGRCGVVLETDGEDALCRKFSSRSAGRRRPCCG